MPAETLRQTFENYLQAWSPVSDGERRRLLDASVSEGVTYFDAGAQLSGRGDLGAHLAGFQQRRAGFGFTLDKFISHHDVALANWAMRDPKGTVVVRCYDMLNFDPAGHVSAITGFADTAAKPN